MPTGAIGRTQDKAGSEVGGMNSERQGDATYKGTGEQTLESTGLGDRAPGLRGWPLREEDTYQQV